MFFKKKLRDLGFYNPNLQGSVIVKAARWLLLILLGIIGLGIIVGTLAFIISILIGGVQGEFNEMGGAGLAFGLVGYVFLAGPALGVMLFLSLLYKALRPKLPVNAAPTQPVAPPQIPPVDDSLPRPPATS